MEILLESQPFAISLICKKSRELFSLDGDLFDYCNMMSEKDFDKILKRYRTGQATEEEVNWIEKWYSSLEALNHYPELNEFQRRKIVDGSFKKIQTRIKGSKAKALQLWPGLSAAAAVILFAVAFILSHTRQPNSAKEKLSNVETVRSEIKNETSFVKHIVLSDSTRISLEPKSSIRIATDFNQGDRRIFLAGEAFFYVSHDRSKPFYVDAGDVVTKVLGTSFRIRAFSSDKNITVAVKTGKVAVQTRPDKSEDRKENNVILLANQQAIYSRAQTSVSKELIAAPQPLKPEEEVRRKLKFEAAPFTEVIDALEDIYGIEIKFQDDVFEKCRVTTTFSDGGIYSRLNIICKAIGASYSQHDGLIEIAGKGCQ
jgi:transmembrane sensor